MTFNRNRAQLRFESLPGWDVAGFSGFNLDVAQASLLQQDLHHDAKDFYYKGTLSICEAINAISRSLFSWATIKLYYSVFYFLRASLASQNIAVLRHKRYFYLYVNPGELPQGAPGRSNSTHESVLAIANKALKASDILLSNTIDGKGAYLWLKEKRERVNYQEREFHEPDFPDFWEEIANHDDLAVLIKNYMEDKNFVYCFQEDHACLALPIKRWELTKKDLISSGIGSILPDEQKRILLTLLTLPNSRPICDTALLE